VGGRERDWRMEGSIRVGWRDMEAERWKEERREGGRAGGREGDTYLLYTCHEKYIAGGKRPVKKEDKMHETSKNLHA